MDTKLRSSITDEPDDHVRDKALTGVGIAMNPMADPLFDPQLEEIEEGLVLSEKVEPMPYMTLYIVMMALINLNDGLMIGYNSALVSLFAEPRMNVPSSERAVLYLFIVMTVVRMFVAPITDKYYSNKIGKRKTYLIPTKIINTVLFMGMSFFIDDLVEEKHVIKIALFFLVLACVMLFENNGAVGLRVDFFGKQRSNAAGAAASLSAIIGTTFGLQIFTSLNSPNICKKYLGLDDLLLDHKAFFIIVGYINILGLLILFFIKEKTVSAAENAAVDFSASNNPLRVVKSLFRVRRLRNIIVWNFFGPSFPVTIMAVASQYYIGKGINREFFILLYGLLMVPFTVLSNVIWVNVTKGGRLAFLMWVAVTIATCAELMHVINYSLFTKDQNEVQTYVFLAFIQLFNVMGNWLMVQLTVFVRAAPKKYAITFISSINSMFSATRIPPAIMATYFMDQISFPILGLIVLVIFAVFCTMTYSIMTDAAEEDPVTLGEKFTFELESGN